MSSGSRPSRPKLRSDAPCGGTRSRDTSRTMVVAATTDVRKVLVLIVTTFALGGEFAAWRRLRPFRLRTAASVRVYEAVIGAVRVRVVLTRTGQAAAAGAP